MTTRGRLGASDAPAVSAHLAAGVHSWLQLQPGTGGSSGISPKQLRDARAAWAREHDARPCPLGIRWLELIDAMPDRPRGGPTELDTIFAGVGERAIANHLEASRRARPRPADDVDL